MIVAAMGALLDAVRTQHPGAPAELEPALEALVAAGRAAWPTLAVDAAALVVFVAARLPAVTDAAVRGLPAADLYLAFACAGGDERAMILVEQRTFAEVDAVVALMRAPAGSADEIKQLLRTRFFVSVEGRPPAIADTPRPSITW